MEDNIKKMCEYKLLMSWQDCSLDEGLSYLLSSGHLADCSFMVKDNAGNSKSFPCHKLILAYSSPVFEAMFFGDFKESNNPTEVPIDDVFAEHFQIFLDFIYHKNYKSCSILDITKLIGIYSIADKYLVQPLAEACIESLKIKVDQMTATEFVKLFVLSGRIVEQSLTTEIFKALQRLKLDLVSCSALYELNSDMFFALFERLKGIYSEKERFALIEKFHSDNEQVSEINPDINNVTESSQEGSVHSLNTSFTTRIVYNTRKPVFNMLLNAIDFEKMTPLEFCDGPGESNLLTSDEKFKHLQHLCKLYTYRKKTIFKSYCTCNYSQGRCIQCGKVKL